MAGANSCDTISAVLFGRVPLDIKLLLLRIRASRSSTKSPKVFSEEFWRLGTAMLFMTTPAEGRSSGEHFYTATTNLHTSRTGAGWANWLKRSALQAGAQSGAPIKVPGALRKATKEADSACHDVDCVRPFAWCDFGEHGDNSTSSIIPSTEAIDIDNRLGRESP
jgi:hypothetical protein